MESYGGLNLKELQLLGRGTQGKVYRIDSDRCIKIFKSKGVCRDELKTLMMGQLDKHIPKVYSYGKNYIIRECINGIELHKYLSNHPLTPSISAGIVELYEAMMSIGYKRLDSAIFHIFITPGGDFKLIDTSKALRKKTLYPGLILRGLKTLGYKKEFLSFVEHTKPDLYTKWTEYPGWAKI